MVTIVNAAETATTGGGGFASFIPIILIGVPFVIFAAKFAKRKGKDRVPYVLMSLIPFVGLFVLMWLASLTDKVVLDRLEQLENKAW